jgi:hypothetical protein
LFRAGELTAIHVLDESEEAVRDLVRCRDDLRRDVLRWRHRVLKLLARHGRAYLAGKNWSQAHWRWIREQRFDLPPLQRAFEATLFALEQALARQAELDKELEAVAATAPYREPAPPQGFRHSIDQALVIEEGVDPAKGGIPELVGVGHEHFDEAPLLVRSPHHGASGEAESPQGLHRVSCAAARPQSSRRSLTITQHASIRQRITVRLDARPIARPAETRAALGPIRTEK